MSYRYDSDLQFISNCSDEELEDLFSVVILDENGGIFIDSGEDRQSGDDLDIRVPFDEEAVHQLFEDDKDYLLEKAKELLKKQ